ERAFGIAARIDLQQIAAALYLIVASLEMDLQDLRDVAGNSDEVLSIETPLGNIIIGSPGDDVYTGPAPALLIEAGGDDLYRFQEPSRLCVIIDLAGEDTYACADQVFLGAGIGGIGVLVDCAGDDRYIGGSFSFGSGFLGAGMLADLDGDDRYVARMFCQGAASFGIGVLYDGAGKDAYSCGLYGQGMGAVAGAGVLVDMDGDDDYRSGYEVADLREKNKGFQTYSQGFATGVRQFAGGGVGLLFDGRGDDRYSGSYFCQGSSYWHALGLLIDEQGDDSYQARRYSQGAGVHASVGALFDGSGDDAYLSWGVSQGCGHDVAVGLLYDSRGSDRYEAGWLSQAAGSSMGIGLLVDDDGDDSYEAGSGSAVQGGGAYDERRDGISLGMLVDRAGRDLFSSLPDRQALWRRGGRGGGIDAGGNRPSVWNYARSADGEPDSPEQQEEQELPAPVRVLDALEAPLLLEASWKQAAEKLVAQGP
ncbi:MAG: hypothetical protein GY868_02415, partial [Deltaproteobacteria bacterium]|nr:hypothetical protein [Deltaproteobacteria bacterium]